MVGFHQLAGIGGEERHDLVALRRPIEPGGFILALDNHGHPIVNPTHQLKAFDIGQEIMEFIGISFLAQKTVADGICPRISMWIRPIF